MKAILIYSVALVVCFLSIMCKGQNNEGNQNSSVDTLMDPVEEMPYELERKLYIDLPNSSKSIHYNGFAVIELTINEHSKIQHFVIRKMKLDKNNQTIINYYASGDIVKYPIDVEKYLSVFSNYVDSIKIKSVGKPLHITQLSIMVRLR